MWRALEFNYAPEGGFAIVHASMAQHSIAVPLAAVLEREQFKMGDLL
jgi:hypothetical protein